MIDIDKLGEAVYNAMRAKHSNEPGLSFKWDTMGDIHKSRWLAMARASVDHLTEIKALDKPIFMPGDVVFVKEGGLLVNGIVQDVWETTIVVCPPSMDRRYYTDQKNMMTSEEAQFWLEEQAEAKH